MFIRKKLLPVFFSLFLTLTAFADATDGARFRALLHDLAKSTEATEAPARADAVREALVNHPEALQWLADERDVSELARDAGLGELKLPSKPQPEWTAGFESLLKAVDANLDRKLVLDFAAKSYSQLPLEDRRALLKAAGDEPYVKIAERVELAIRDFKISNSSAISMVLDPKSGLDLSIVPAAFRDAFIKGLQGYFDVLPPPDKRRIIIEVLALPPDAPVEKQLSVVLHNCGPAMQKLFQLFSKDAKSPVLKSVLEELLANVKPFDGELARQTVEARLGRPINEVFSSFETKPLNAGTIGQIHVGTLKSNGQKVVIKVRRPGLAEQAHNEMSMLRSLVKGTPEQEEVINKLEETLNAELDFLQEARNLDLGQSYSNPELGIHPVGREASVPATSDVLVMQFANGKGLAKLTDKDLVNHGSALTNLLKVWTDEAMFKSGFFHGDLHPGNIMYEEAPGTELGFRLNIIDFGSADTLTVAQRRGFARLMLGIYTGTPEAITDGLSGVAHLAPEKRAALIAQLKRIPFQEISLSEQVNRVLSAAMGSGLEIPSSLLKFNRGRMFLELQIADVNRRLDSVDPEKRLPRFNAEATYKKVAAKRALQDLLKQLVSSEARENSTVTFGLVAEGCGMLFRKHFGGRGTASIPFPGMPYSDLPVQGCRALPRTCPALP